MVRDIHRWLGVNRRSLQRKPQPTDYEEPRRSRSTWVLTDTEKRLGYARPLRYAYTHKACGATSRLIYTSAVALAYNPERFDLLPCSHCARTFPTEGFVWFGSTEQVGT